MHNLRGVPQQPLCLLTDSHPTPPTDISSRSEDDFAQRWISSGPTFSFTVQSGSKYPYLCPAHRRQKKKRIVDISSGSTWQFYKCHIGYNLWHYHSDMGKRNNVDRIFDPTTFSNLRSVNSIDHATAPPKKVIRCGPPDLDYFLTSLLCATSLHEVHDGYQQHRNRA
ncbi:hypothetical protein BT63DRAFT_451298 [Microthyrium microscopicum]|uniref:Uncharacterized protein n=1 Tax=Microthyrium microscopicum TaxID=703497 RepID=A0A6A6UM00_9PEZI|nr:hypothetical protein BT63DRAFT_451298 [Microthyrium microscopicum]